MNEPATTILVVDVGNSTTVVGFVGTSTLAIDTSLRLSTNTERSPDEWRAILLPLVASNAKAPGPIQGAVISSVVPRVTRSLKMAIATWLGVDVTVVDARSDLGLTVAVDHPLEVGSDRLMNAVAAQHLIGSPAIVVDAGTATKVDVVSANEELIGGAIAPGIGIGLDALAARAARLYAVDLAIPARAIGRNTTEAIQSGLIYGHVAMVEGLVKRFQSDLGENAPVVVTGGYGQLIAQATSLQVRIEPNLTLIGAAVAWLRESKRPEATTR